MRHRRIIKAASLLLAAAVLLTAVPLGSLSGQEVQAAEETAEVNRTSTQETLVLKTGMHTLENQEITAPAGQSAVRIEGDVTLYIEGEVTLTGGDAYFKEEKKTTDVSGYGDVEYTAYTAVGAGAGIEVPEGSSLTLVGSGTLTAREIWKVINMIRFIFEVEKAAVEQARESEVGARTIPRYLPV